MLQLPRPIFSVPFIPHGHCYLWQPQLVGLHLTSDALIALAYYSIPIALLYFVRKRQDLPYPWIFLLFGAFITACGTTHVMEVWTLWHPTYWLSGAIKVLTAFISLYTAATLLPLIPAALALPSPAQLEAANRELAREIAERQQVQEVLRESEERFRNAFDYAAIGMALVALDGRWFKVNRVICEITGYSESELLATNFQSITHPDDLQTDLNYVEQLLKGEIRSYQMEKRYFHKQGHEVWVLLSASLVRDTAARPLYFIGQIQDITAHKQAEEALRASEEFNRKIVNSSQDCIKVLDLEGRLISMNPGGQQSLEIDNLTPLLNTLWLEFWHAEDYEAAQTALAIARSGGSSSFQGCCPVKGKPKWWDNSVTPILDAEGKPERLLSVARDISAHKQAELELQRAKEEAVAANQAKSLFLANMSHELRTPLNAILGFTRLISRDRSLSPSQQERLSIINRSGEHLLDLIDDILALSTIETGRMVFNPIHFYLHGLLSALEEMFQLRATAKELQLIFECSSDVPQWVQTDERKLRQVLINLLGNAIKFTQTGRVTLRVVGAGLISHQSGPESTILANPPVQGLISHQSGPESIILANPPVQGLISHQSGPESTILKTHPYRTGGVTLPLPLTLYFQVEDTGPGIAPEEINKLFEMFSQTETGQRSRQGTGLGLAISQKFVQLMGGEIRVDSTLGQGSVFSFAIPVTLNESAQIQSPSPTRRVIGLLPGQATYRLLIVEDREENRRLLLELLAPLGFEVQEATNGAEAIALWESWSPHLIWMDMRMPVMDGYEAIRQIRARENSALIHPCAIVALTASAFEEDRVKILATGCDDFVRKPFQEQVIFEKMAQHLGVQYIYESVEDTPAEKTLSSSILTPSSFQNMPHEWLVQMHSAAYCLDAEMMAALIEQIPESNATLAEVLTELVNNFDFDPIMNSTRSLIDGENESTDEHR